MNIRRGRHLTDLIEKAVEIAVIVEFDQTSAEFRLIQHFAVTVLCEFDLYAGQRLTARVHEDFPCIIALRREEQHLHLAAGILLLAIEARRNDFRVIEDENIAFADLVQDITEMVMLPLPRLLINHHQAAGVTRLCRFLSNQFFG